MRERQALRSSSNAPKDKINNQLIAVPGAPGSGKSTFLKHFPASQAYTNYIAERSSAEPAIISSITFNSCMSSVVNALGLRILYGTLISMGYLTLTNTT